MVRDSRKMVILRGGSAHPLVRIFSCAGQELARFMWTGEKIVGLGWSNEQQLLIVDQIGQVDAAHFNESRLLSHFNRRA